LPLFHLSIESRLAEIGRASDWLAEIAGSSMLDQSIRMALRLCLEEALANVVTHAYPQDGVSRPIGLELTVEDEGVSLVVEDEGPAFDPTCARSAAVNDRLELATIGGRGLTLIRSYASGLGYVREAGRNRFTMNFSRDRSAPGQ